VSALIAGGSGKIEGTADWKGHWNGEGGCGSTRKPATFDSVAKGEACCCKYMLLHIFE